MERALAVTAPARRATSRVDARRLPWFRDEDYPFQSRYLEVPGGRLHYVDEGPDAREESGSPILFVHGTPSFSYEYRELIRALRGKHRCIAPDHLGFGLSDRPEDYSYSLEEHTQNLRRLVQATGLEGHAGHDDAAGVSGARGELYLQLGSERGEGDAAGSGHGGRAGAAGYTLVLHDFGGPIGLPLALEAPRKIERLVIMNSWAWSMDVDPKFAKNRRFVDTWLMRFLYLRANFSASFMVKASWGTRQPLTPEVHRRFKSMFPDRRSRLGTWAFARTLVREDAYLDSLRARLSALCDVPVLVIWGMADGMVGAPHLARWREELPHAEFVELADVGHFPQEEAGAEVAELIRAFIEG